jgi:hypothetical protein
LLRAGRGRSDFADDEKPDLRSGLTVRLAGSGTVAAVESCCADAGAACSVNTSKAAALPARNNIVIKIPPRAGHPARTDGI